MKQLTAIWHGELTLQKVFWEWAVLGGIVINLASSALFIILVVNGYLIAALIVGYGLSISYNIVAAVGVWRSAERYGGDKRWADLAKVATVVGMVLLSIT